MSSGARRGGSRGGRGGGNRGGSSSRGQGRGSNSNVRRGPRPRSRGGAGRRPDDNSARRDTGMRDEDILIAFMPYLKKNQAEAVRIHEDYQNEHNQAKFLKAARDFLEKQEQTQQQDEQQQQEPESNSPLPSSAEPVMSLPPQSPQQSSESLKQTPDSNHPSFPVVSQPSTQQIHPVQALFGNNSSIPTIHPSSKQQPELATSRPDPPGISQQGPITPPRQAGKQETSTVENSSTEQPSSSDVFNMGSIEQHLGDLWKSEKDTSQDNQIAVPLELSSIWGGPSTTPVVAPKPITPPQPPVHEPFVDSNDKLGSSSLSSSAPAQAPPPGLHLPATTSNGLKQETTVAPKLTQNQTTTPTTLKKDGGPGPKRLWTHFEEQPGRILVDGISGQDPSLVLSLGPREELSAHWILPVKYLQQQRPQAKTTEEVLRGLMLGLFRRGCTENGTQSSIISKAVLGENNRPYDYWTDAANQSLSGRVPFFSPRTPGHVIFRLYWENDPIYTLAMGPSVHVRVSEKDFEATVRFILNNFKSKKTNPTSLSSLHSLAVVLETPLRRPNDSAARAVWGCIQEARKVVEACYQEYLKTTAKLGVLEETVEELKKQVEDVETKSQEFSIGMDGESRDESVANEESEAESTLREKTRELLGGRASCERKWRDSQLAFAGILRAVVTNPCMQILLRRDMITKMRMEFELWCPLSEEFAVSSEQAQIWYEPLRDLPQSITAEDFRAYTQARVKMQLRTLSFEPNMYTLDDVLFPRSRGSPAQRIMDPGAVLVFNAMSAAMGQYYQSLHADEDVVVRQRESIRSRTEQCVQKCGAFPPGTRVVIFGSSANGFGSPKSDIDMCLQLPKGNRLSEDDSSGAGAMAKLATYMEESGMKDVDTCRLTARIPIIKYCCPNPLTAESSEEDYIECDLSMHNPLAVLNTGYLRCYAEITPIARVLASIIKRWAKARDINNPSGHTLSSYGYIIMLLHFLTFHKRTGNGLISPVTPDGNPEYRRQNQQPTPILPNLHWMDPSWPNFAKSRPYHEIQSLPRNMIDHPLKENKTVNTYYYRPSTPNEAAQLQMIFSGQDLSLAILLASFFRYYAYEFDYKRHVVSLHSTASRGVVEREVKAELDGWRNYTAALTIEDPFETFYDVAHVLRGGHYHRIRREFAVAYSKIADAASGRPNSWNKGDLRSMTGQELIDFVCEPVSTERDKASS